MSDPLVVSDPNSIIRECDLAMRWGKSVRTLQRLRRLKQVPRWLRIGATVYYRMEDILAFERASRRGG